MGGPSKRRLAGKKSGHTHLPDRTALPDRQASTYHARQGQAKWRVRPSASASPVQMQEIVSARQNVTGTPQHHPRTRAVARVLRRLSADTSQPSASTGVVAFPPPIPPARKGRTTFRHQVLVRRRPPCDLVAEPWPVVNAVTCSHHVDGAGEGGASRAIDQEIVSSGRIDFEDSNSRKKFLFPMIVWPPL